MFHFDFFDKIKDDDVVKDYTLHANTIHSAIINTSDANTELKFGSVGMFPLIANFGEGKFDIIHHLL